MMVSVRVSRLRSLRLLRVRGIVLTLCLFVLFFFFQAEDGIRDYKVTGVQTCALPISGARFRRGAVLCGVRRAAAVGDGVAADEQIRRAAHLLRQQDGPRRGQLLSLRRPDQDAAAGQPDRKSTRLNSSHLVISYAVFCLKKK